MHTTVNVTNDSIRDAFNDALDFALDVLKDDHDAMEFLRMWREGQWPEIDRDFPEWAKRNSAK